MKYHFSAIFLLASITIYSQNLQLHYDFRHSLNPEQNARNFPTANFEYFKSTDSSSFLFKMQSDFADEKNNMGKAFMQVSKSIRFWKPKIQLHLSFSAGLGITEPRQYSYSLTNTYEVGIAYLFQWKNTWFSSVFDYKYNPYAKASHDFIYTLYWWKGLMNYKIEIAGDFSIWTENKDHGNNLMSGDRGKRFFFYGEPQAWFNINKSYSIGSRVNLFYHVLSYNNLLYCYPTIAVKYKIK